MDRSALMAAVAERDFDALRASFEEPSADGTAADAALRTAASALIDYGLGHPARYRLLFSDPGLEADEHLRAVAFRSFLALSAIVARAQEQGALPAGDAAELTGLIYAALHGAPSICSLAAAPAEPRGSVAWTRRRACCSSS